MDYRYFPDPDLPPLDISQAWIDRVRKSMPELPAEKHHRLTEALGLPAATATVLTESVDTARYFENAVEGASAEVVRLAANWIAGNVNASLNQDGLEIGDSPLSPAQLRGLVERIADGTLSGKLAKEVFEALWKREAADADAVIAARGLKQISDSGELESVIAQVVAANPKSVEEFRAGKDKAFNALVGQIMKATQGKANPAQVNTLLRKKLEA